MSQGHAGQHLPVGPHRLASREHWPSQSQHAPYSAPAYPVGLGVKPAAGGGHLVYLPHTDVASRALTASEHRRGLHGVSAGPLSRTLLHGNARTRHSTSNNGGSANTGLPERVMVKRALLLVSPPIPPPLSLKITNILVIFWFCPQNCPHLLENNKGEKGFTTPTVLEAAISTYSLFGYVVFLFNGKKTFFSKDITVGDEESLKKNQRNWRETVIFYLKY